MPPTATPQTSDRVGLGIVLVLASTLLVALQEALIKEISSDVTLWQIFVLRSAILVPALLIFALGRGDGVATWRRALRVWPLVRTSLFLLMYFATYSAIRFLPLSTIAAGLYTAPLFVALISSRMIGEPVRLNGWVAIAIGFGGVLLILKPGGQTFIWAAVLPVAGGLMYALTAIVTRTKCRSVPPSTLAASLAMMLLVVGSIGSAVLWVQNPVQPPGSNAAFLAGTWGLLGPKQWLVIVGLAVLMFGNSQVLPAAYQSAPPTIIVTFDYFYMVFATLLGFVLFAEVPDLLSVCGMVLIAVAGVIVASRR